MADTAALKLGNIISTQITGALGGFASGLKGSFISANPTMFGPMVGAISKGFSSMNSQSQKDARKQREESQRAQGFAEERGNEQRKYEQVLLAVQKGMAINIESIQKDVRAILDIMSKETVWDKLSKIFAGLAAGASAFIDEILRILKVSVDKIGTYIADFIKFLQSIPGRIGSVIDDIVKALGKIPSLLEDFFDLLKNLPNKFMSIFDDIIKAIGAIPEKIGSFFSKLTDLFDNFVTKYFPETRTAIGKFFSDLADMLKIDSLKSFFTNQLENLKNLFKFDDLFKAIGTKFDDLIKLLDESEIAKAFRKIRNIFAISFAQYADEMEDLFNNKILASLGKIKASIASLGEKIPSSIDELVDAFKASKIGSLADSLSTKLTDAFDSFTKFFKESRAASLAEDLYGRISSGFTTLGNSFKESKVGVLMDDITNVFKGLFTDFKSLIKFPSFAELEVLFDLGKNVKTLDEFKYLFSEAGMIGKVFTTVGTVTGVLGTTGTKVLEFFGYLKDLFSGPLKLLSELSGLTDLGRFVGAVTPFFKFLAGPLAIFFTLLDGIMGAADTKALQETFGTKVIGWKERVGGFFGGVVGGIFGLFDLIGDIFGFSTKDDNGKTLQERVTAAGAKLTKGVLDAGGKLIDLIVGIFTFDVNKIKAAGTDLFGMIKNSFAVLGNIMIDSVNWLIDKLPEWLRDRVGKLERIAVDSSSSATGSSAVAAATPSGPATGNAPPVSAEAAALMSQQGGRYTYTASDLKRLGLNVKEGDVQKPNAFISSRTIQGAQWLNSNYSGIRFTGFNDSYHDKQSPASSHTKGLAFDFTIPVNLASDNQYRKSLATAIANSTGGYVIDEYAYPSAKSTGGHFHVDFDRSKGVKLGTGNYLGEPPVDWGSTSGISGSDAKFARQTAQPSDAVTSDYTDYMYGQGDDFVYSPTLAATTETPVSTSTATSASGSTGPLIGVDYDRMRLAVADGVFEAVHRPGSLSVSEALNKLYGVTNQEAKRQSQYDKERAALQQQFQSQLQGIFRPMVESLRGPAGSFGPQAMVDAGKNLSTFLRKDFSQLGVKIFGKQYGEAIGGTFQQLAGVYLNEFINESLAPMLGMNSGVLNRAINTYVKGVELLDPKLKEANLSLMKSRETLDAYVKQNKEVGLAEIVTAAAKGGFTPEQKQRISQLTALRGDVANKQKILDSLNSQKKQYKEAAFEDLIFGMTGISLGPRTMLDQYEGGAEGLTKDLASFFGAPFKPLFGTDSDPVQVQQQMNQNFVLAQAKVNENNIKALEFLYKNKINPDMSRSVAEGMRGIGGGEGGGGGGTSIPGYRGKSGDPDVDIGTRPWGKSGDPDVDIGPMTGKATQDRLLNFGQNLLLNAVGSKISGAFGGGLGGSIMGKLGSGAISGFMRGENIAQSIGSQFGLKLGPNATFTDLTGGLNSAFTSPISTMGNMFTSMATSKFMPSFMAQGMMDFGTGMQAATQSIESLTGALTSGNVSNMAGAALGAVGAGFQGYGISKAISGGYSTGLPINEIAGIASMIPGIGPIAGVIGGLVNRAFGRKAKQITGTRLAGTVSGENVDLANYTDWFQKGGWFRSDKRGTDVSAIGDDVTKSFMDLTKGIVLSSDTLLKALGGSATDLSKVQKSISIAFDLNDTEEKKLEKITKAFEDYRETLLRTGNEFLTLYSKTGETLTQTAERLSSAMMGARPVFQALGFAGQYAAEKFFGYNQGIPGQELITAISAKVSDLLEAFGGVEKFNSDMGQLIGKMFSPKETAQINLINSLTSMKTSFEKLSSAGIEFNQNLPKTMEEARSYAQTKYSELRRKLSAGQITSAQFAEGVRGVNAYLATSEQKISLAASGGGVFDASKFIPIVDAMGNAVPGSTGTTAAPDIIREAREFVESLGGLLPSESEAIKELEDKEEDLTATGGDGGPGGNGGAGGWGGNGGAGGWGGDGGSASANANSSAIGGAGGKGGDAFVNVKLNPDGTLDVNGTGTPGDAGGTGDSSGTGTSGGSTDAAGNIGLGGSEAGGLGDAGASVGSGSSTGGVGAAGMGDAAAASASDGNSSGGGGDGGGGGGGDGGGGGCVDPNVPVYISPNNTKRAGDIIVGDFVYTTHQDTLEYGMYKVIGARLLTQPKVLVTLHDETQIKVSTTHKFLLTDGTWKEMFHLDIGSEIQTMHGGYKTIIHVQDIGEGDVIMFTVDDAHTYIADGLISHNESKAKGGRVRTTSPYIVGEVGPELFIPNVAGTVVPTDRIIDAVRSASSLDSQTRNLLEMASPNENPVTRVFLDQQSANRILADQQRDISVNSAVVDNSVTTVSSPRTNIINRGDDVRSSHPVAGIFTRSMTGART